MNKIRLRRCGNTGDAIILVGANDNVITCSNCYAENCGAKYRNKCGKCGETLTKQYRTRKIADCKEQMKQ